MSDAHETHIADTFGVRRTRGSGNQFRDQTDGRSHRYDEAVAFAFDGKSTFARSTTIKRDDLDKLTEQSDGERPCLAVRFYDDERLRGYEDWYLTTENDLLTLIERSRTLTEVQEIITRLLDGESHQSVVDRSTYLSAVSDDEMLTVVRYIEKIING